MQKFFREILEKDTDEVMKSHKRISQNSREIFRNHKRVLLKPVNRAFSISLKKNNFLRIKREKRRERLCDLKDYFWFWGLQSLPLFKIEIVSLSKVVSHGF